MDERVFRRRRGGLVNVSFIDIDDASAIAVRRAMAGRRFHEAEALIDNARNGNERVYLLEAAADWTRPLRGLDMWASSGSRTSRTVHAIHKLKLAWNHTPWTRGSVDVERFRRELDEVHRDFDALAGSSSADASFFFWFMWMARAKRDPDLARKLYAEASHRDPSIVANHSSALYSESQWWFGSDESLMALARRIAATAPSEIQPATLLIEAYKLRWTDDNGSQPSSRWKEPQTRADVIAADDHFNAHAENGICSMRARQWLAYGLWATGDFDRARPHLEAIGTAQNEHPWHRLRFRLDRFIGAYASARRACLKS